jgi:competence ComEA-like helix-hairpin-helix protein
MKVRIKRERREKNQSRERFHPKNFALLAFFACFAFSVLICFSDNPAAAAQNDERIDINIASVEELMRLPGVGAAIAARIVDHRRRHGPFKRPQDIVIVRGISVKLYRRISPLIRT